MHEWEEEENEEGERARRMRRARRMCDAEELRGVDGSTAALLLGDGDDTTATSRATPADAAIAWRMVSYDGPHPFCGVIYGSYELLLMVATRYL